MIPIESFRAVVAFLRGEAVPTDFTQWIALTRDFMNVINYGLDRLADLTPAMESSAAPAPLTVADCCNHLDRYATQQANGLSSSEALPWGDILRVVGPVLLDVLTKLLNR